MENGDCVNIIRESTAERLKAVDQELARAEYTSIRCKAVTGPGSGFLSIQYTPSSGKLPRSWEFEYTVYAAEQELARVLEI